MDVLDPSSNVGSYRFFWYISARYNLVPLKVFASQNGYIWYDIIRAGTNWQTKLAGLEMKKNDVVRIPNAILFCCYVSLSDDKIATVLGRI